MIPLFLAVLFAAALGRAAAPPSLESDVGSFFHQVTRIPAGAEVRTRQLVSPVAVRLPFLGGVLEAHGAAMYVEQSGPGGARDVWGPLDTRLRGVWEIGRLRLALFARLPTGKDSLDAAEADLVRTLQRSDLNFPVRTFGRGLDYGGALALAHQAGPWGLSAGAAVRLRGEYDPFSGVTDYRPGDEVTGTAGLAYTTGGWRLHLDLAGTFLFTDRLDGLVIFQNGKQLTARAGVRYRVRSFGAALHVVEIARLKDRRLTSAGRLLYEDRDSNGNDLRASAEVSWNPHRVASLFATAHLKDVTANDRDPSDPLFRAGSRIYGYGGGFSLSVGPRERLRVHVQRYEGWTGGGDVDVEAWNVRASLRLGF